MQDQVWTTTCNYASATYRPAVPSIVVALHDGVAYFCSHDSSIRIRSQEHARTCLKTSHSICWCTLSLPLMTLKNMHSQTRAQTHLSAFLPLFFLRCMTGAVPLATRLRQCLDLNTGSSPSNPSLSHMRPVANICKPMLWHGAAIAATYGEDISGNACHSSVHKRKQGCSAVLLSRKS